jgi:hypothetical protein
MVIFFLKKRKDNIYKGRVYGKYMDAYSHLSKLNNQSKNFTLNHWLFHETIPGFFLIIILIFKIQNSRLLTKLENHPTLVKD